MLWLISKHNLVKFNLLKRIFYSEKQFKKRLELFSANLCLSSHKYWNTLAMRQDRMFVDNTSLKVRPSTWLNIKMIANANRLRERSHFLVGIVLFSYCRDNRSFGRRHLNIIIVFTKRSFFGELKSYDVTSGTYFCWFFQDSFKKYVELREKFERPFTNIWFAWWSPK